MARAATIVLTGDAGVNAMLRTLAGPQAKKVIRTAARKALKPVAAAARTLAPRDTGALAKAVKIRALKRSRSRTGARVTIGAGEFIGKTFYGGFQEWGWTTKSGRKVAGLRFLREAADTQKSNALMIYRNEIRQEITKLARRAAQSAVGL